MIYVFFSLKHVLMRVFTLLILLLFFVGCKSVQIRKHITKQLESPFNAQHFSGVFIYNPTTKDTILNYNGDKYFTPASNTKIATLFSAFKLLKDSIPAYTYAINSDTISIQGTGNPTAFHAFFKDSTLIKQLKNSSTVKLFLGNLSDAKYGNGWAWEDYDTHFSPERNSFPLYGNVVHIKRIKKLEVTPEIFEKDVVVNDTKQGRKESENTFYFKKTRREREIPFIIDTTTTHNLWNNILPNKHLQFYHDSIVALANTKYSSIHIDSLYKRMMVKSDNFLAEQILIMASSKLSDTLSSKKARKYILKNHLNELPYKPRWVDGSGLSRYNLFTPSSFVYMLNDLYNDVPEKRLFNLFPKGGVSGTLKNWFKNEKEPYIIAKSGTLGNNYSLSGFLKTKSGKVLIFSFMNNHFKKKTSEVKKEMEAIFKYLHNKY